MPQQVAWEDGSCSLKYTVGLQTPSPWCTPSFLGGEQHPFPPRSTCSLPPLWAVLFAPTSREAKRAAGLPQMKRKGCWEEGGDLWAQSKDGFLLNSAAARRHLSTERQAQCFFFKFMGALEERVRLGSVIGLCDWTAGLTLPPPNNSCGALPLWLPQDGSENGPWTSSTREHISPPAKRSRLGWTLW
ncbi:hypothetical protein E2320_006580 [Naja naja]|nr:hypothetical protein E2320_006580 [Naja naja]